MSYATPQDYEECGSGLIPADQLEQALSRASDQIDMLTYNRIAARGFDNLTPFQQTQVKKAVCRQADFWHQYGDMLSAPMTGFGAGSISWSFGESGFIQTGAVKTTDEVMGLLLPTGLANRGLRR
jgi:hypothetical protein